MRTGKYQVKQYLLDIIPALLIALYIVAGQGLTLVSLIIISHKNSAETYAIAVMFLNLVGQLGSLGLGFMLPLVQKASAVLETNVELTTNLQLGKYFKSAFISGNLVGLAGGIIQYVSGKVDITIACLLMLLLFLNIFQMFYMGVLLGQKKYSQLVITELVRTLPLLLLSILMRLSSSQICCAIVIGYFNSIIVSNNMVNRSFDSRTFLKYLKIKLDAPDLKQILHALSANCIPSLTWLALTFMIQSMGTVKDVAQYGYSLMLINVVTTLTSTLNKPLLSKLARKTDSISNKMIFQIVLKSSLYVGSASGITAFVSILLSSLVFVQDAIPSHASLIFLIFGSIFMGAMSSIGIYYVLLNRMQTASFVNFLWSIFVLCVFTFYSNSLIDRFCLSILFGYAFTYLLSIFILGPILMRQPILDSTYDTENIL